MADFTKKFLTEASDGIDLAISPYHRGKLPEEKQLKNNMEFPSMPLANPYIYKPHTAEEKNYYQSSGVLLSRLAESISQWRLQLSQDVQPAIIAILHGGIQINVERLSQESFHGIRIEGTMQTKPCVVLAHQSTVQLLCMVQTIAPPEHPARTIGFIIEGKETEA